MNFKNYFVCFFILIQTVNGLSEGIGCDIEALSSRKIQNNQRYQALDTFDTGHHKTLVRIHNLPSNRESVTIMLKRPLFGSQNSEKMIKITKKQLLMNAELMGETVPVFICSSRGYLPGEKIFFSVECEKKEPRRTALKSEAVEFIPNPAMIQNEDGASLAAVLVITNPTTYRITLSDFQLDENLKFLSISSGETGNVPVKFEKNIIMNYMPGVINKRGGKGIVTIVRENGERMTLQLPWGSDFLNHLKGNRDPAVSDFPIIEMQKV